MRRKLARTCCERTRTSASSPFARYTCRAAHGTCLSSLFPNTGTVFLSNRKLCSHAQPNSACTCGERAKTSVQNRRERRSSSARHMCRTREGLPEHTPKMMARARALAVACNRNKRNACRQGAKAASALLAASASCRIMTAVSSFESARRKAPGRACARASKGLRTQGSPKTQTFQFLKNLSLFPRPSAQWWLGHLLTAHRGPRAPVADSDSGHLESRTKVELGMVVGRNKRNACRQGAKAASALLAASAS